MFSGVQDCQDKNGKHYTSKGFRLVKPNKATARSIYIYLWGVMKMDFNGLLFYDGNT
jgi:hypothetical protein